MRDTILSNHIPSRSITTNFSNFEILPPYLFLTVKNKFLKISNFVRMLNRSRREVLLRRDRENGPPHLTVGEAGRIFLQNRPGDLADRSVSFKQYKCDAKDHWESEAIENYRLLQVTCLVFLNPVL